MLTACLTLPHVCRLPKITWVRCAAHCLDLALEDMGRHWSFKHVVDTAKKVVFFITNHHAAQALFPDYSPHKELLKPGETRFYTAYILSQRLSEVKLLLGKMVWSQKWHEWASKPQYVDSAAVVRSTILDERGFWEPLGSLWRPCLRSLVQLFNF